MKYFVGFDIGGTNIKFVAASPDGTILLSGTMCTEDSSNARRDWQIKLEQQLSHMMGEFGVAPVGIGVASPGLASRDARSISWMQGRMQPLQHLDWTRVLASHNVGMVPVLNDAHAALIGEVWCGAATDSTDVSLLTLGTGVGGACLVDGHLLRGAIGRAGHLGHICLDAEGTLDIVNTPGSLEEAIGECSLPRRSEGRFERTSTLIEAYLSGDEFASAIWLRSVRYLACGMVSIINVVDPEVFILGGGIGQAGSALFDPLNEYLNLIEWRPTGSRVRVVSAQLGEYAGALGAAFASLRLLK